MPNDSDISRAIAFPDHRQFFLAAENLTLQLLVTHVGSNKAAVPPTIVDHVHAYVELIACVAGRTPILFEGSRVILEAGDLALVPAGLPHHIVPPYESGCWRSVGILLERRRIRSRTDLWTLLTRLVSGRELRIFRERGPLCRTVGEISGSYSLPNLSGPELGPPLDLLRVLLVLANDSPVKDEISKNLPYSVGEINRALRLERLLDNHFDQDLTLGSAASRLFISPSQLNRIANRIYGTSFHKALTERRLNAAARLLTDTDSPAGTIALTVGFTSRSCFWGAFRKRFGMSPDEYRRTHKAENSDKKEKNPAKGS